MGYLYFDCEALFSATILRTSYHLTNIARTKGYLHLFHAMDSLSKMTEALYSVHLNAEILFMNHTVLPEHR